MPTLNAVLRSNVASAPVLGSSRGPMAASRLANDLRDVSNANRIYFAISFAAVVVVFLGASLIVAGSLGDPERIRAVFAALGISVVGLITLMVNLWKQKVSADMLIVLCGIADDAQIHKVINKLLNRL